MGYAFETSANYNEIDQPFKQINNQPNLQELVPANSKVSVGWQIVFTFLPIVNFWAFYRIRKLRRYVLYVIVPEIILSIIIVASFFSSPVSSPYDFVVPNPAISIMGNVVSIGLQALSIYLVIIWSRQHNRQFDQPTAQSTGLST